MGCYVGIGVILIIFVFPETLNHSYLSTTALILGQIQGLIDMQQEVLDSPLSAFAAPGPVLAKITGARMGILQRFQASKIVFMFNRICTDGRVFEVASNSKFLNLEFSWGKWSGDDVKALEEPLLGVVTRTGVFHV